MPTRRALLSSSASGLGATVLALAGARTEAETVAGTVQKGSRADQSKMDLGRKYLKPVRALTLDDFRADPAVGPGEHSAAYDPKLAHLFDGLKPRFATRVIKSRFIPMRDGVRLSTDLHIPLGAKLPLPVILVRTPYSKNTGIAPIKAVFPEQGFVLAVQDVRGRHESEGVFVANAGTEREDGYDTVEWLTSQPWCNGRIGAWGSSYLGEMAARLSAMRHPNHRCSIIMFDGSNAAGLYQNGAFTQDGVVLLRDLFTWFRDAVPAVSYGPPAEVDREAWFSQPFAQTYSTQPVQQPPVDLDTHLKTLPAYDLLDRSGAAPSEFTEMLLQSSNPKGSYFDSQRFLTDDDHFNVPALHFAGLPERGDSAFANFHLFRRNGLSQTARDNQFLMFVPTPHSGYMSGSEHMMWGVRDFGDTRFPYLKTFVDWFAHWLREEPNSVESWPKVRHYVMGLNRWRAAPDWPPPDVREVRFYLRSQGGAGRHGGDGRLTPSPAHGQEPPDRFTYDPANPCPSEPPNAKAANYGDDYADFAPLESRPDVLVYTSDPLPEPIEIGGPVKLVLYVSSSAKDTDFTGMLLEIDEQGRAVNVTQGLARARYREGLDRQVWMKPGEVYQVPIDLWFASARFERGRRLRLHVSSSRFPQFDRNLNTGGDNYTETAWVIAENSVHHSSERRSYLSLPVRSLPA